MKQTTQEMIPPIEISFFSTGLFTHRSQLYAPFRSLGINVVSYHDPLIGGQDMEVTDLMELQRRPGYSRFCSVQLGGSEIINQFYSTRALNGSNYAFYDSNLYWSLFTSSSITHLLTKNTTAQGYLVQISDKTYYQNGVDAVQWNGANVTTWGIQSPTSAPTMAGTGFWSPGTAYTVDQSILDGNGNVELVTIAGTSGRSLPIWPTALNTFIYDGKALQWQNRGSIGMWIGSTSYQFGSTIIDSNNNLQTIIGTAQTLTGFVDQFSVSSGVASLYIANVVYSVGQVVTLSNFQVTSSGAEFFNGQTVTITAFGGGIMEFSWPYPDISLNACSGTVTPLSSDSTGTLEPSSVGAPTNWATTPGSTTVDGQVTWTCIGPGNQLATTGYSWRYAYRTLYGHLSTSSDATPNTGPILGPSIANIASFSITSNVATFVTSIAHGFVAGTVVYINNMSTGTYFNNLVFTVLSAGLTSTHFEVNFTHADVGSTSDAGTADPVPVTVAGVGTGNSLCNYTASITNVAAAGNIITFTCSNHLTAGLAVNISGLSSATQYNGWQFIVESASNPANALATTNTQFTAAIFPNMPFYNSNYASHSDSGTATFAAVEIYRTADGGGLWYYSAAVVNPGAATAWSFADYVPDDQLDPEVIAPVAHLNDPPPGQPGSLTTQGGTILKYWQGRLWMAVGNRVYFDGGSDIINGVPYECWPPANVFAFPGPVTGLAPTSQGMLVFLSDRVDIILGGPQTYSFYSQDLLKNFGLSNPNAMSQDGDSAHLLTTAGQFFQVGPGRQELGSYVADLIQQTFNPTTAYVTVHRNGLDAGVFIGDGSANILRHGLNIGAWSTMAKPVNGIGAIQSIETTVGTYTLCAGRPTGGGYILGRNLNTWQDDSQNYTLCQATIGSISLSQPGAPLLPVHHIVAYFNAVGTLTGGGPSIPQMQIMPNEISSSVGVGFLTLPETVPEPPTGQTIPSQSLLQLRWPVNMVNSTFISQLMHHLQVRITFAPENAPNTVKSLAIKGDQD